MTAWLSTLLAFALTVSAVTLCALVLTPMLRNRVSARSLPPRTSCLSIQAARCLRPAQFSLPVPCNGARCCAWFT